MRKMSILAMTDPVSYNKYNKLQNIDNQRCLSENVDRMTWRGGDRVLDIGSGDGSFTATELRRFLPGDVTELVGCDRSREMVDFANERFGGDGVNFRVLEIGKPLPAEFIGSFDHVFAFYSLHWVTDQRLALSQVHDVLTSGGDCLLLIVGRFPAIFDVYKALAESPKWDRWVKRLNDNVLSPYHDCDDPENKLRKHAEEVGFKNVYVKCNKSTYTYDSVEAFKNMIVSINPFNIPEELCEEYLDEFVGVARERHLITEDLTVSYTTHTLFGRKLAFSQTYDMLAQGGDCLLLMVAYFPLVFDVYRWLSRSKKWSKWIVNLDDLISPYHDCEDPEMKLRKYAEEAGFKDIHVKNTKSTYTYASEQDIKNMMTSLNPFQIPEELMKEYLEEIIRVSKAEGYLSDTLTITYSTNTLYARKY